MYTNNRVFKVGETRAALICPNTLKILFSELSKRLGEDVSGLLLYWIGISMGECMADELARKTSDMDTAITILSKGLGMTGWALSVSSWSREGGEILVVLEDPLECGSYNTKTGPQAHLTRGIIVGFLARVLGIDPFEVRSSGTCIKHGDKWVYKASLKLLGND